MHGHEGWNLEVDGGVEDGEEGVKHEDDTCVPKGEGVEVDLFGFDLNFESCCATPSRVAANTAAWTPCGPGSTSNVWPYNGAIHWMQSARCDA